MYTNEVWTDPDNLFSRCFLDHYGTRLGVSCLFSYMPSSSFFLIYHIRFFYLYKHFSSVGMVLDFNRARYSEIGHSLLIPRDRWLMTRRLLIFGLLFPVLTVSQGLAPSNVQFSSVLCGFSLSSSSCASRVRTLSLPLFFFSHV